jgi:hypothetical protein
VLLLQALQLLRELEYLLAKLLLLLLLLLLHKLLHL